MSKRKKIILGVSLGLVLLLVGAFVVQAKGIANISVLADYIKKTIGNTGNITVRVVDQEGNAVQRAAVRLYKQHNHRFLEAEEVNSGGLVRFFNKPYGSYSIEAVPRPNTGLEGDSNSFDLDSPNKDIEMKLEAVGTGHGQVTIWGRVYGLRNNEIEGGQFHVYKGSQCQNTGNNYLGGGYVRKDQHTLPDGNKASFWARDLSPDQEYCFQFSHFIGYQDKTVVKKANDSPEFQSLFVNMGSGSGGGVFTLKGKITTGNGSQLIKDAVVKVRRQQNGRVLFETKSSASALEGESEANYKIEEIPLLRTDNQYSDYYHIAVEKDGYQSLSSRIRDNEIDHPETVRDFNLQAQTTEERSATVKGKVTVLDNNGEHPAVNTDILLEQKGLWGVGGRAYLIESVTTDQEGKYQFTIKDQPNNTWGRKKQVVARYNYAGRSNFGYYPGPNLHQWFDIEPGDEIVNADIHIDARVTGICGTVTKAENNQPLEGAVVKARPRRPEAHHPGSGELRLEARTAQNGTYCLNYLRPEVNYEVSARYFGANLQERRTTVIQYVYVPKNKRVKADFQLAQNPGCRFPGYVNGYVFDREGNPVNGATVSLSTSGMVSSYTHPTVRNSLTDQNGKYYLSFEGEEIDANDILYLRVTGTNIKNDQDARHRFRMPFCGVVYRLDFYINRPNQERWTWRKDVEIWAKKRYLNFDGTVKKEEPFRNLTVQLVAEVGGSSEASSYSFLTEHLITDANGVVSFKDIPKGLTYRIKISGIDRAHITPDEEQMKIQPNQQRKLINIDFYPVIGQVNNPTVWARVYMRQNDPRWENLHPRDFSPGHTIGGYGCCVTSVCMALKYYYPNKNINPRTFLRVTNNLGERMNSEDINRLIRYFDSSQKVRAVKVGSWTPIKNALGQGYPVVVHTGSGGWDNHGVHCALVTKRHQDNIFSIIDPHPKGGYGKYPSLKGRNLRWGIIFKPKSGDLFQFNTSRNKQFSVAKGAGELFASIKQNDRLRVFAQINSQSMAQAGQAEIEVKRADGQKESYPMRKFSTFWRGDIPGFTNQDDFSFRILAYSDILTKHQSQWQSVQVRRDNSIGSRIRGSYSRLTYRISQSNTYQRVQNLIEAYNNWVTEIRSNYLTRIGKGDIAGIVRKSSGQPLAGALVKIGANVGVTDQGGYYRINNLPARQHRVLITNPKNQTNYIFSEGGLSDNPRASEVTVREGVLIMRDFVVD